MPLEASAIALPRLAPKRLAMVVTDAWLVRPWPNCRNRNTAKTTIHTVGATLMAIQATSSPVREMATYDLSGIRSMSAPDQTITTELARVPTL